MHELPLILAIDDDPSFLRMLERTLAKDGFRVACSESGEDGILQAEQQRPDLILLDINMPEVDGFETCERLKNNPKTRHIPVVFLTAEERSDELLMRSFGAGANDYVTKPFSRIDVLLRIRSIVQQRNEIRELGLRSMLDRLTELPNRSYMRQRIEEELNEASRYDTPVSLIFTDIDSFENINNMVGMAGGDTVLANFAKLLRCNCRRHDIVSRWGADKFAILLPRVSMKNAMVEASRLRDIWSKANVQCDSLKIICTASFGVVDQSALADTVTAGELTKAAESTLQQAKQQGSNTVCAGSTSLLAELAADNSAPRPEQSPSTILA